ncbi:hypothetical protein ACFXDE_01630 [Kitasatospora sp. NPDC059408]
MIRRFLRQLVDDQAWYGLAFILLTAAALALITLALTAWSTRDD